MQYSRAWLVDPVSEQIPSISTVAASTANKDYTQDFADLG